jgi:hypothetical protein
MKAPALILTTAAILAFAAPAAYAASDVTTVIRPLSLQAGIYQVQVVNTSGLGVINAFDWVPPEQLTITGVRSTIGGTCRLAANVIRCNAGKRGIAPPTCTCRPGGSFTFTFTSTGLRSVFNGKYWTYYGVGAETVVTLMAPTLSPITSAPAPGADAPICQPGTQPGPDNDCVVE